MGVGLLTTSCYGHLQGCIFLLDGQIKSQSKGNRLMYGKLDLQVTISIANHAVEIPMPPCTFHIDGETAGRKIWKEDSKRRIEKNLLLAMPLNLSPFALLQCFS